MSATKFAERNLRDFDSQVAQDLSRYYVECDASRSSFDTALWSMISHLRRIEDTDELLRVYKRVQTIALAIHEGFEIPDVQKKLERAPEAPKSRAYGLRSVALLGFDFKITPNEEVKIIEINGYNSGMKGFAKISKSAALGGDSDERRADKAVQRYFDSFGEPELSVLGTFAAMRGMVSWRLPIVKPLVKDYLRQLVGSEESGAWNAVHPEFLALRTLADGAAAADGLFHDKFICHQAIKHFAYREQCEKCDPEGYERILDSSDAEFIVVKPAQGSLGKNVLIKPRVSYEDLIAGCKAPDQSIIEPFVPSKPIFCRESKKYHDACARYICIIEATHDNQISVRHAGGYWRAAPLPITESGNIDAMRANLAKKAFCVPLSANDEAAMWLAAEELAPTIQAAIDERAHSLHFQFG